MTEGTDKKGKGGVVKRVLVIAGAVALGVIAASAITYGARLAYNKMRGIPAA